MKIGGHIPGFNISAKGLSVQRKRMNLIAENIANSESTRTADGKPYTRKFMVINKITDSDPSRLTVNTGNMPLRTSNGTHIPMPNVSVETSPPAGNDLSYSIIEDQKEGEKVFMPSHPDADENGYVMMSNVNVVEEMVEMIAASRSYEANLTALNSTKEIAKDSLEI